MDCQIHVSAYVMTRYIIAWGNLQTTTFYRSVVTLRACNRYKAN